MCVYLSCFMPCFEVRTYGLIGIASVIGLLMLTVFVLYTVYLYHRAAVPGRAVRQRFCFRHPVCPTGKIKF